MENWSLLEIGNAGFVDIQITVIDQHVSAFSL